MSTPSIQPYRYPHIQKTEIEHLINEMLAARIMHVNNSLFSSLVLLVKKKDVLWRVCVNYRTLNKEIVPDKYPITVIDKLYSARIISKLDLESSNNIRRYS